MRKNLILGIILVLLIPNCVMAAEEQVHPLKEFIRANAGSPDRVTSVQSSASKRMGKVLLGGVLGALAGAAHAKLTGGNVGKEMAIGAAAGSAMAFAITKIQDRRLASRDEVASMVSYDPSQGYRNGVQEVTVTPSAVQAGGTITVKTSYWAIGPGASGTLGMSRYAGIAIDGTFLRGFTFRPDPMSFDGGGLFETTVEVHLPPGVSPGTYSVVWLLDGYSVTADSEATFVVSG